MARKPRTTINIDEKISEAKEKVIKCKPYTKLTKQPNFWQAHYSLDIPEREESTPSAGGSIFLFPNGKNALDFC